MREECSWRADLWRVKFERFYDEHVKHQVQSYAFVDKLGESEAGAGETEQR